MPRADLSLNGPVRNGPGFPLRPYISTPLRSYGALWAYTLLLGPAEYTTPFLTV